MGRKSDRNLICFFSWGRRELTERCFTALLPTVRPQDRLLVVDNEGLNMELYLKYMDKIDYFFRPKLNYFIGPIWTFIRCFVDWLFDEAQAFERTEPHYWTPDFINIVESDALVKPGWIDECLKAFSIDRVMMVSGYDSPVIRSEYEEGKNKEYKMKTRICGVNVIADREFFCKNSVYYTKYTQDKHLSLRAKALNFKIAIVTGGWVEHIGDGQSSHNNNLA
jgi:hypothetical protein